MWLVCFKNLTSDTDMTRNDIQVCIQYSMHCAILQYDEISVQFRHFYQMFFSFGPNTAFVSNCFLQMLMACNDSTVFSQNTQEKTTFYTILNEMY